MGTEREVGTEEEGEGGGDRRGWGGGGGRGEGTEVGAGGEEGKWKERVGQKKP